jgi:hypothetical protein
MSIEPTGFCWNCGRMLLNRTDLFCPKWERKCEASYQKEQNRQIKKGKRAGYGATGSTH